MEPPSDCGQAMPAPIESHVVEVGLSYDEGRSSKGEIVRLN